ncbi:MAG TPA: hypothetical protein VF458_24375 [Ktedonobacteraceae bacterium]
MEQRQFDLALWLLPSSAWPEIVEVRAVDPWALPFEVVQAVMQEQKETYVYKAAVGIGSGSVRRYWHVKLPLNQGNQEQRVQVDEVVKQLWPLIEADGVDPVEVNSRDALSVVQAEASCEPGGLFASWCLAALAADVRVFIHRWNVRRAVEVRWRLALEIEQERSETRR